MPAATSARRTASQHRRGGRPASEHTLLLAHWLRWKAPDSAFQRIQARSSGNRKVGAVGSAHRAQRWGQVCHGPCSGARWTDTAVCVKGSQAGEGGGQVGNARNKAVVYGRLERSKGGAVSEAAVAVKDVGNGAPARAHDARALLQAGRQGARQTDVAQEQLGATRDSGGYSVQPPWDAHHRRGNKGVDEARLVHRVNKAAQRVARLHHACTRPARFLFWHMQPNLAWKPRLLGSAFAGENQHFRAADTARCLGQ